MKPARTDTEKCTGKIERLTVDDMDELIELHSRYLNYGPGVRPHFEEVLRDERTVALKYVADGEIVGLIIYVEGIHFSGGHEDLCKMVREVTGSELTYTGDAVLVKEEYRHTGVTSALFAEANDLMKQKDVRYAVYELWVLPDGRVPAEKVLKATCETESLGLYENFYREFCLDGYLCPICGRDCICSAKIYLGKIR